MELILALALSSLILAVVGIAIDLHLRTLDARRANIEDALLARAVLRLIADDLRGAVQYKPIEVIGLDAVAADDGRDDDTGGAGGQGGGPEETGEEFGEVGTGETESLSSSVAPPTVPGLYGNQYELQVDVSRLPRIDEYDVALTSDNVTMADIPSDVKTVSYYLATGDGSATSDTTMDLSQSMADGAVATLGQSGLVRRELDRAVTAWAVNNGSEESLLNSGVVVAPEVADIQFAYFDGTDWVTEWDSDENEGLPVAVEIALVIQRVQQQSAGFLGNSPSSEIDSESLSQIFRLVVHLPIAEASSSETSETFEEF